MTAAQGRRFALVAAALSVTLAAAPARAGDDGQASLITGLAQTFGLSKTEDPQIDYRERSKLVLPPKRVLPPPAVAQKDSAWPVDNEVMRARKLKQIDDGAPSAAQVSKGNWLLVHPGDDVKVTTSGLDHAGPACRVPDPKTGECPAEPHMNMNWNPMTWVGLEKKPAVQLGPEPERENLVDPPKGYRAPAEGVGVKVAD